MGQHGVGDITNNGAKLVNMCEEMGFVIGDTLLAHRTSTS